MHRRPTTLYERLGDLLEQANRARAGLAALPVRMRRQARAIGTRFARVRSVSRGAVTATLVIGGFMAAATALVSLTAAAPTQPTTATADARDRAAAAARADRGDRAPDAAASAPATEPSAPVAPAPVAAAARRLDWVSPMPGTPLSSCFGARWGAVHQGIDFAGNFGTPVQAVGSGTVFGAGWLYAGYGISVVIDHGNGVYTHYAHLSQAFVVEGQRVNVGDVIGLEGSTGDSTGPHLHFEVHQGLWHQIDPAQWFREHGVPAAC
jgi:murein DD-endopeptidase MepM/ murein hydrolase activator NlpD